MCLCAHVPAYAGVFLLPAAQLMCACVWDSLHDWKSKEAGNSRGKKTDLITRKIRDMDPWEANCMIIN